MLKLTNTTDQPIESETGHVIPANDFLETTAEVFDRIANQPYIRGQILRKNLLIDVVPNKDAPKPITRKDVAKANRSDLVEILVAHGMDRDNLKNIKVDDEDEGTSPGLRTMATTILFMEV